MIHTGALAVHARAQCGKRAARMAATAHHKLRTGANDGFRSWPVAVVRTHDRMGERVQAM